MNDINKSMLICIGFLLLSLTCLKGQDDDDDELNDNLEQALALKYAPEWRFSKRTIYPDDDIGLNSSNQNEDFVENYPCSVDYLVYGNQAVDDGLPNLRFESNPSYGYSGYYYTEFDNINSIATTPVINFGSLSGLTGSDVVCNQVESIEVCLSYANDLKGEPNSFPTYYYCNKTSDQNYISLSYFLFSAFDNKHETGSGFFGANHRGDWEYFTIFIDINSIDFSNNNINNSSVAWIKFFQHGGPKQKLQGNSNRLRWVLGTHPKMYVARTSHAIYPEPGVLYDYDLNIFVDNFDTYDDIFLGNGLIVQSWNRNMINIGDIGYSLGLGWLDFKGKWGCDDSPFGPYCKVQKDSIDNLNIISWEEVWITDAPEGHLKYWSHNGGRGLFLDCDLKFSTNYSPDPGYGCSQVVDCRRTCYSQADVLSEVGSDLHVWGSLSQAIQYLPSTQTWQVCLMPCSYPEPVTIDKPMVLKAIEGPVTLGQ